MELSNTEGRGTASKNTLSSELEEDIADSKEK